MPPEGLLAGGRDAVELLAETYGDSLRSVVAFWPADGDDPADQSPSDSRFAWHVVYRDPALPVPDDLDTSVTESGLESLTVGGRRQAGLAHHGELEAVLVQHAAVTVVTIPDEEGSGLRVTLTTTDFDKDRVVGRVKRALPSDN